MTYFHDAMIGQSKKRVLNFIIPLQSLMQFFLHSEGFTPNRLAADKMGGKGVQEKVILCHTA